MSVVIIDGIDKIGKSTIAELYAQQGYEVIHMSAPDKKFNDPKYTGPTYFDEMVSMYSSLTGDVVFDRSIYGEMVWPRVYRRRPQLLEPDINYLKDIENDLGVRRILLIDSDREAHWNRCVEHNEPLTREQFDRAYSLYATMADKYEFEVYTFQDLYKELSGKEFGATTTSTPEVEQAPILVTSAPIVKSTLTTTTLSPIDRLAEANAINDILAKRIIVRKGAAFERIEKEIREFLTSKMGKLLGNPVDEFSPEEIKILKVMAQRLKDKQGSK